MLTNSPAQHSQNETALEEFRKALALDENDLDALEQVARQAKLLNLNAAEYLEKMERAALEQKMPARQARALRFQAEMLEERSADRALSTARTKLESAIRALDATDNGAQEAADSAVAKAKGRERLLERALANEQLGGLQLRRGKYTRVRAPLDEAERRYNKLSLPDGPAGLERIQELRDQLAMAEQGGDEPDEPDDELVPFQPTHVNFDTLVIFREAGAGSAVTGELPPLTAVTLLKSDIGWARVAKGSELLGYVDETKLHKLN